MIQAAVNKANVAFSAVRGKAVAFVDVLDQNTTIPATYREIREASFGPTGFKQARNAALVMPAFQTVDILMYGHTDHLTVGAALAALGAGVAATYDHTRSKTKTLLQSTAAGGALTLALYSPSYAIALGIAFIATVPAADAAKNAPVGYGKRGVWKGTMRGLMIGAGMVIASHIFNMATSSYRQQPVQQDQHMRELDKPKAVQPVSVAPSFRYF